MLTKFLTATFLLSMKLYYRAPQITVDKFYGSNKKMRDMIKHNIQKRGGVMLTTYGKCNMFILSRKSKSKACWHESFNTLTNDLVDRLDCFIGHTK